MEPDPVQSRILIGLLSLHHQAKFGQYTNVFCTQISEDIFEVNRMYNPENLSLKANPILKNHQLDH